MPALADKRLKVAQPCKPNSGIQGQQHIGLNSGHQKLLSSSLPSTFSIRAYPPFAQPCVSRDRACQFSGTGPFLSVMRRQSRFSSQHVWPVL